MGVILPKPVTSKVVERGGNAYVSSAVCSINGYRTTMEDAHAMVYASADRMLFGVFDGHSNAKCSAFVAERLPPRILSTSTPISDATFEKICLEIDEEFIEQVGDGGTTATFCLLERNDKNFQATINNIGDSRILHLRDGHILTATVDHKPGNPDERARIEACGGVVRMNRVDGDLAVSRAFGDSMFKKGTDDLRVQKVIAVPDIIRTTLSPGDVLLIACDGVFEGSFPSEEVAQFVHQEMERQRMANLVLDLALVAARTCDQAVRRGSKDNITCMLVHISDGQPALQAYGEKSFVPGPPYPKSHDSSRSAYTRMANMAGVTLADALQMRYRLLQAMQGGEVPPMVGNLAQIAFEMSDEVDLEMEKAFFGNGPPPGGEAGWFAQLADPYNQGQ